MSMSPKRAWMSALGRAPAFGIRSVYRIVLTTRTPADRGFVRCYRVNVSVPRDDDSRSAEPEIDAVLSPPSSARYSVSSGALAQYALVEAKGPIEIIFPLVVYAPEA